MKISLVIPIYDMPNKEFFLWRAIDSVMNQTYRNYEIVITKVGKMAENTNYGIFKAQGDIVKILYMDDYLAHPNALKNIVEAIGDSAWLVSGCNHDPGTHTHLPSWNEDMKIGKNTIGSPSVLTMRRDKALAFDENLSWLLDCDLYDRLYKKYGEPVILEDINVTIGVGEHQHTHLMPDNEKLLEYEYMRQK